MSTKQKTSNKRKRSKSAATEDSLHDDSIGHWEGSAPDHIADRYEVIRDVGLGTFGRVIQCKDTTKRQTATVAIKVIRSIQRYSESAHIEANILRAVNTAQRHNNNNSSLIVQLLSTFTFANHYCLVFEMLGISLFDFQKNNNFLPFQVPHIFQFAEQLLDAVEFLHSMGIVHTDLKAENVLLVDSSLIHSRAIKLIDFGGATFIGNNELKVSERSERHLLLFFTLHYITLHYITLHYITLHYITLHYITLHYITLHYITNLIQFAF